MKVFYVSEDVSAAAENEPLKIILERCFNLMVSRMPPNYSRFNGQNLINQLKKSPERVFYFVASLPHEFVGEVVLVLHVDADFNLDRSFLCKAVWRGIKDKPSVIERIKNGELKLKVVIASPDPCLEAWLLMKSGGGQCGHLKHEIEKASDPACLAKQVDLNALEKSSKDFADFMEATRKSLKCENPCQSFWPR